MSYKEWKDKVSGFKKVDVCGVAGNFFQGLNYRIKAAEAEFMDREMKALQKRYEAEKVKIRAQMAAEPVGEI